MWKTGVPRCDGCGAEIKSPHYPRKDPELKMVFCGPRCRAHYLLAKTAKLAGYVSALLVILLFQNPVVAEQNGHGQYHGDAYSKWLRNDTKTSCCNLRIMSPDGDVLSGDCRPVEAELRRNEKGELEWWAQQEKGDPRSQWIRIPESVIIREKNPDLSGNSAHLCATASAIYCFVGSTGTN